MKNKPAVPEKRVPNIPSLLESLSDSLDAITGSTAASQVILETNRGTLTTLAAFADAIAATTGKPRSNLSTPATPPAAPSAPVTPTPATAVTVRRNYTQQCVDANDEAKRGQPTEREKEVATLRRLENSTDLVIRGIVQRRLKELNV